MLDAIAINAHANRLQVILNPLVRDFTREIRPRKWAGRLSERFATE